MEQLFLVYRVPVTRPYSPGPRELQWFAGSNPLLLGRAEFQVSPRKPPTPISETSGEGGSRLLLTNAFQCLTLGARKSSRVSSLNPHCLIRSLFSFAVSLGGKD